MYERPLLHKYSGEELSEMLGPVETQYTVIPPNTCDSCSVDASGDIFEIGVDVFYSECLDFDSVSIEVVGPTPGTYNLPRSAGDSDSGAPGYQWRVFLPPRSSGTGAGGNGNGAFQPGIYSVNSTLFSTNGNTSCSSISFNILAP